MITALLRTVILYAVVLVGLRLTGKRQIGELEPTELVLTMLISDLAAVPIQDFSLPLLYGIMPIVALLCLSLLLSCGCLYSLRFRALLCGRPTIIIRDGKMQQSAMRRNRLTIDELMEELRCQGVTDLNTVKYAILETSGQLSVLLRSHQQPVTPEQMELQVDDDVFLPIVIINDGRVLHANLKAAGRNDAWLRKQLQQHHIARPEQVFLLTVDPRGVTCCVKKEDAS